jgi:Protein of unknown function (DUF664)
MTTSETATASASFSAGEGPTGERADLLESLRTHRYFLRHTAQGLTDEQARLSPTASVLTVGGLIKHVSAIESGWADFAERGTEAMPSIEGMPSPEQLEAFQSEFRLLPGETLAGVLDAYEKVAARTDALVESLDLDTAYPLPKAPWFAPGATRSVRRVFIHIVAETAQHAGHADIIRETIDGQKTMG